MHLVDKIKEIDYTDDNTERFSDLNSDDNSEFEWLLNSNFKTVASLGWVTPGASTEGVTPIFYWKTDDLFLLITVCQFCGVTPIYFLQKTDDLFCSSLSLLLILLGCHPLEGVTLLPFHLSDLVCPLFFVNLPTNFFPSGVTPWRMWPGAVRPLVMPLLFKLLDFKPNSSNFLVVSHDLLDYSCIVNWCHCVQAQHHRAVTSGYCWPAYAGRSRPSTDKTPPIYRPTTRHWLPTFTAFSQLVDTPRHIAYQLSPLVDRRLESQRSFYRFNVLDNVCLLRPKCSTCNGF